MQSKMIWTQKYTGCCTISLSLEISNQTNPQGGSRPQKIWPMEFLTWGLCSLSCQLVGYFVGWLAGCLLGWLGLVAYLVTWLLDWSFGWLVRWSATGVQSEDITRAVVKSSHPPAPPKKPSVTSDQGTNPPGGTQLCCTPNPVMVGLAKERIW